LVRFEDREGGRYGEEVAGSGRDLAVMLAVLLAAAPALFAQEVSAPAGSEVEAMGYLSPAYPRNAYSRLLNDEATGQPTSLGARTWTSIPTMMARK
jgi:hypothetical protein